jgi:hypothetical protein
MRCSASAILCMSLLDGRQADSSHRGHSFCFRWQSCDLDSMVSSLTYAHLLSEQLLAGGDSCGLGLPPRALVLPFWQVERRDIALRPEATWLFGALGMECIASLVFCTDDLADLRARCAASATAASDGSVGGDGGDSARCFGGWVLCDHNAPTLAFWPRGDSRSGGDAERVWAIVDHHVDAGRHMDACPRIVEVRHFSQWTASNRYHCDL